MRIFKTILLTAILLSPAYTVFCAEVASGQARAAVQAWLREDSAPLHARMGQTISSIETYRDSQNSPLYHVVNLNPSGFAIVAADDLIEPIVAFAADGRYDPSLDNPLGALINRDLPERMKHARKQTGTLTGGPKKARNKWTRLQDVKAAAKSSETNGIGRTNNVSDVRVDSLVQSRWSQTTVSGIACYNYYTPPNTAGSAANYPCGCVATMMAQLMRYYQYPTTGVGTASFQIKIDGNKRSRSLRGGDGNGGAYSWSDMTLVPSWSTPDAQRQAIGALTADAGVSVKMQYTASSSGAFMSDAKAQLKSTFMYNNAIYGRNNAATNIGTSLNGMVNPNLDAGYPVLFGISDTNNAGHAIVCDGYGYNLGTLYHHLNLGWGGTSDAWYALPVIDTGVGYTFTSIEECVYNVYTVGAGEIISGRVTDSAGSPLTNATVTAVRSGGGTYTTNTNVRGIYAFPKIPANSTYTLSVSSGGYNFTNQTVTTGLSTDNLASSGNRWGVDFVSFPVVTFDAQGGSAASPASMIVTNGSTYGALATTARIGYTFGGWWTGTNGAGSQVLSATTVTITSAQTLYAKWTANNYTLTVNNGSGGGSYIIGQQVAITANSPVNGKTFDQWTGDTAYVDNVTYTNALVTMPAQDIALTATYKDITYVLAVNIGTGDGNYTNGAQVVIVADAPEEGQLFDQWIGTGVPYVANIYEPVTTVTMPEANIAVTATYKSQSVLLTATAGANGMILPPSTNVSLGSNVTFTITATNYYRISTLNTNSANVAGVAFNNTSTSYNYTWTNVQAAGTVTVDFVAQVVTNPAAATVPYSWLAGHGLTNYETDAVLDPDSDGLAAWHEYIAGTNPTNAASCFKAAQNTPNKVSWSAVSGRVYSVYWATNLLNSFQTLETNIVWPQASYTDTVHGAESRSFYKVKVQLAP